MKYILWGIYLVLILALDLIDENQTMEGFTKKVKQYNHCKVTWVNITNEGSKKISKKAGYYITIEFDDVTDHENEQEVLKVTAEAVKHLLEILSIQKDASCFIVGLGNEDSTPDALGPLSIDHILVTNHLFALGEVEDGFRKTYALNPGVMGTTGIETRELLKGIVDYVKPDFMIVVDALASGSVERLNKTIQITDTGIHPGSGVQNKRKEISSDYFHIPVIAIGIPTVVDAATIVSDTIYYMQKNFSYMKKQLQKPSSKLAVTSGNYLKKEVIVKPQDNIELMGKIGMLTEEERKQLVLEVLTPIGYNFIVTPKEIDFLINKLSYVIGSAINHANRYTYSFEQ